MGPEKSLPPHCSHCLAPPPTDDDVGGGLEVVVVVGFVVVVVLDVAVGAAQSSQHAYPLSRDVFKYNLRLLLSLPPAQLMGRGPGMM